MKTFLAIGALTLAISICNLSGMFGEKTSNDSPNSPTGQGSDTGATDYNPGKNPQKDGEVETPKPNAKQEEIMANSKEMLWDEQGMSWKLPSGWNKISKQKNMLNYGSPSKGFLIVSISPMSDSFPTDTSLKATYEQQAQRAKNGDVESFRYLEIDGVKGVEFIESMPENKSDARRHQWIAFRTYNDQVQMLNVMLSTKGSNFDSKRDTFAAIMYSMKVGK